MAELAQMEDNEVRQEPVETLSQMINLLLLHKPLNALRTYLTD
jgi:hypothetical protein